MHHLRILSTVPSHQQMCLRGEDILNDPYSYFEKLCRWLNLAWDKSIFESILCPQDSPYASLGPYGAQLGNDSIFLKSPTFHQRNIVPSRLEGLLPWREDGKEFLPKVIRLAQELGYQ